MVRPPNRPPNATPPPEPEEPDDFDPEDLEEDESPTPLRSHRRGGTEPPAASERRMAQLERALEQIADNQSYLAEQLQGLVQRQALVPSQPVLPPDYQPALVPMPQPRRGLAHLAYRELLDVVDSEHREGRFVNPGGIIVLGLPKHLGKLVKVWRDDFWGQEVACEPIVPRRWEGIDTHSALVTGLKPGNHWVHVDWIWMRPRKIYIDGDSVQVVDLR